MIIVSQNSEWLHNTEYISDIHCKGNTIVAYNSSLDDSSFYLGEYSTPQAARMAFERLKRDLKNNLPYIEIMTDETAMEYVRAHKELMGKE